MSNNLYRNSHPSKDERHCFLLVIHALVLSARQPEDFQVPDARTLADGITRVAKEGGFPDWFKRHLQYRKFADENWVQRLLEHGKFTEVLHYDTGKKVYRLHQNVASSVKAIRILELATDEVSVKIWGDRLREAFNAPQEPPKDFRYTPSLSLERPRGY